MLGFWLRRALDQPEAVRVRHGVPRPEQEVLPEGRRPHMSSRQPEVDLVRGRRLLAVSLAVWD